VLEPFCGLASIGTAAVRLGRGYLGIEPDGELAARAHRRLARRLERTR
jgi:DNA modification methylase